MKVLHVITGLGMGGAEGMLLKVLPHLEGDHSVCSLMDLDAMGKRIEASGIKVHYLGLRGLNLPLVAMRFMRLVRRERPDIINSYLLHTNIFARLFGRLAGVNHIICSVRNIHRDRTFWNLLDRLTQRLVDTYTPNSEAVKQWLIDEVRIPEKKVMVIPNCVDTEAIRQAVRATDKAVKRRELGIKRGEKVLLYVASFKAQKAHEDLIEAASILKTKGERLKVLLAGTGSRMDDMKRLAKRLGVKREVRFLGNRSDVFELFAITDAFVFPTLHEGMPNALMEAAAAGLPIVCTDIPENREVIGVYARYFSIREPKEIVSALTDTSTLASGRTQTAGAQKRLKKRFGIETTVALLDALYNTWRKF